MAADSTHVCQCCIDFDRIGQNQSISFTILCYISQFVLDRLLYRIEMYFFSIHKYLTGNVCTITFSKQTHGKLCTARSHQTGNTDNLSFMYLKGYVIYHFSFGVQWMIYGPVLDFHVYVADLYIRTFRETVCQLTTNHSLNNAVFRNMRIPIVHCLNRRTISDDCNLICNISNFI